MKPRPILVRTLVLSALVGLLGGTAALAAKVVAPGPGQKLGVDQVVLILDASSSLGKSFDDQRNLARAFASGMPDGSYQVSTLVFGGGNRDTSPLSSFDRSQVTDALSSDRIGAGTPLADVIGETRDLLAESEGRIAVVIFSDGSPTAGGRIEPTNSTLTAASRLVSDHPDRICLYGVQSGDSKRGAGVLQKISAMTGCGSFQTASSLSSTASLSRFQQSIFLTEGGTVVAALPAVSAAPPAMMSRDGDGDGVPDKRDLCAGSAPGVPVDGRGCSVIAGIPFDNGSSAIADASQPVLNIAAATLAVNDDVRVRLTGRASASGTPAINEAVSQKRAQVVKERLVASGIEGSRIEVGPSSKAMGEDRAEDRRVDIEFLH